MNRQHERNAFERVEGRAVEEWQLGHRRDQVELVEGLQSATHELVYDDQHRREHERVGQRAKWSEHLQALDQAKRGQRQHHARHDQLQRPFVDRIVEVNHLLDVGRYEDEVDTAAAELSHDDEGTHE